MPFLFIDEAESILGTRRASRYSSILSTLVNDPEMQGAQSKDIRESFSKRAMMNNINVVTANDIEIVKDARGLSLSISYQVKIPLVGNASLLLEFNPSSFKK